MAVQTIHDPKEHAVNVTVEPGQTIAFDFDLSTANFERTENDLTITLDDGGQVVLDNFFVADGPAGLPPLQLADGTQVNSSDFLSAFDVDVTPAAAAAPGGGLNSYDDGAGSLIDGLDLSDSLGTFQWTGATAAGEYYEGVDAPEVPAGMPPVGPPPVGPAGPYLAVLYVPDMGEYNNGGAPSLNINLPGAAAGDELTVVSSESGYITSEALSYVDGKWVLNVSQEGLAAMLGSTDTIRDNIIVEYNGVQYNIQVVLTQDGSFTSSAEGEDFISEWYTDGDYSGRYEEITYLGGDNTPGEAWLKGLNAENGHENVLRTYENTSNASSVVHVETGVIASGAGSSNTVTTGLDAASSIDVGGNVVVRQSATNTLTSGNISVTADDGKAAVINEGGVNELNAAFNINLHADKIDSHAYGVSAETNSQKGIGAQNLISADESIYINARAEGQINATTEADAIGLLADGARARNMLDAGLTVTIIADSETGDSFAMYAANKGMNVITLTGGADGQTGGEVNLTGDFHVENEGQNIINGSAGDDVITLNGAMRSADALIIHGGDGTDKLVLMAGDSAEFISNYGDWLANNKIDGIESITVEVGITNQADYDALHDFINGLNLDPTINVDYVVSFSDGTELTNLGIDYISGGLGEQSVNIDGLVNNNTHDYNLSDLAQAIDGFEQIDLSGNEANTLTIDSLLGLGIDGLTENGQGLDDYNGLDLINNTVLRVTGDAGTDTIELGADWSSTTNQITYDGQTYDIYTNDADTTQILLIQSGLGIV